MAKKRKNRRKNRTILGNSSMGERWAPTLPSIDVVNRPQDLVRKYRISIDRVLATLRLLFPSKRFAVMTKFDVEIFDWANSSEPKTLAWARIPPKPTVQDSASGTPRKTGKKKKRGGKKGRRKPVYVPMGGQPGFKRRHRYK